MKTPGSARANSAVYAWGPAEDAEERALAAVDADSVGRAVVGTSGNPDSTSGVTGRAVSGTGVTASAWSVQVAVAGTSAPGSAAEASGAGGGCRTGCTVEADSA